MLKNVNIQICQYINEAQCMYIYIFFFLNHRYLGYGICMLATFGVPVTELENRHLEYS